MKHLSAKYLLAGSLLLALFSLNACQKEALPVSDSNITTTPSHPATDRDQVMYGITAAAPGKPSLLTTIQTSTGGAVNGVNVYLVTSPGHILVIQGLKGVCTINGEVFVTTGPSQTDGYGNMLLKADPYTGEASIVSYSNISTVTDIDYDATTNTIYGLSNNANKLVTITYNDHKWGTYRMVGNITHLGNKYLTKGLSMVHDADGDRIVIAATRQTDGNAQLYRVAPAAGAATLLSVLTPSALLATGHCGIGFNAGNNQLIINRTPINGYGYSLFAVNWTNPMPATGNALVWSTSEEGYNYVDLSTNL